MNCMWNTLASVGLIGIVATPAMLPSSADRDILAKRGGHGPGSVAPGQNCGGFDLYMCEDPSTGLWCGKTVPFCTPATSPLLICAFSPFEDYCVTDPKCEDVPAEKCP